MHRSMKSGGYLRQSGNLHLELQDFLRTNAFISGPERKVSRSRKGAVNIRFMNDVTTILNQLEQGDDAATDSLLELVYDELRRLAAYKMSQENAGQTLTPTALVHEAGLRLVETEHPQNWKHRNHFIATAVEAMRRILIERARRKERVKHGTTELVKLRYFAGMTTAEAAEIDAPWTIL